MLQPIRPFIFTQRTIKTFEAGTFTPHPSVNAAAVSASEVVTQIIDTLKPNYRNADKLALETEALPLPDIDLNNLMITVDLSSFGFMPLDFMTAVKTQPHITALVGLPFTFFYSPNPDAAIDLKPWFYLKINAEQMTQLTRLPTSTSETKTVHLYNEQSMHAILGIAAPLPRPPISTSLALETYFAPDFTPDFTPDDNSNILSLSDFATLEAEVLAALAATPAGRRFSRLPADYPPGLGFDDETPKPLAASSAATLPTIASDPRPRNNSSSSGSGPDSAGAELLQPFAINTGLGTPRKRAPSPDPRCCTIS